jgi:multicomponent Na+:H+ antiporter subunit C
MSLAFSVAVAVLFGVGAYLLLERDLLRVVAGIALISQSAVVALIGAGLTRGPAPIAVAPGEPVSDPLPQALALTALVIGLATVALLLALVHRVVMVFRSVERDDLAASESAHEDTLAPDRQHDQHEAA